MITMSPDELKAFTESVKIEFENKHDRLRETLEKSLAESAKREQETLDRVNQIHADIVAYLSEIDNRSQQRTAIVRRSNALTNATSRYVVQVIISIALLGFLWSQISETQRRNWANLAFPMVGVSAMILLGLPIANARKVLENAESPSTNIRSTDSIDSGR